MIKYTANIQGKQMEQKVNRCFSACI